MGMPQFPERKEKPCAETIVLELLESVAVEELALAHILNAEGEKLQELVRKYGCNELGPAQFDRICGSTHKMINSIIMKEWILLNKVQSTMEVYEVIEKESHQCHCGQQGCRERKDDGWRG